ncbi:CopD family protein [Mycobacterium sp.]|uniref:CopD family protein n=1 Tax=Mycobacterium sp. TaxID=1785 RepID=UPI002DA6C20E|nr:CopD family protein [Mycobacterium sp.]
MTRRRAVAGGVLIVVAASVAAWSLASPQNSLTATLVRAVADCAAVTALGLAVVPMLDQGRYRGELIGRATASLSVAGAVWLLAELVRLVVAAAQAAGVPVVRLGVRTSVEFAMHTAAGRAGLLSVVAAAAVCLAAAAAPRTVPMNVAVAGLAAVGVAARPLAGHFSESALGGLAVALHTLAAALWCGVLAGLVLTVEHRGQWARLLPRFSQLSVLCVAALLVGGVVGAAVTLTSPAQLYGTGYGRVLSAKVAVTVVLIVLAWRNRTIWLPAARTHRASAVVSRSRSRTELAIMAVALALAAALAVTG